MSRSLRATTWQFLVALVCLVFMGMSVTAYSDTYNFFFKKGKKQQESSSQDEGEEEEEEGSKPQVSNSPAPTASEGGQSVTANGKSPIVINNYNQNNNNVGNTGVPNSKESSAPLAAAPPPREEGPGFLHDWFHRPGRDRSPFKLGLSTTLVATDRMTYSSYDEHGPVASSAYSYRAQRWGGLLSLGYNFSQGAAVTLYGGGQIDDKWMAGLDLELIPFRIPVSESLNIFELGFLLGGSTLAAAHQNIGSLHAGARVAVNLSNQFGITATGRANLGMWMLEAGLTTRL